MNITFSQRLFVVLGFSILAVVGSGFSAQAQTVETSHPQTSAKPTLNRAQSLPQPGTASTSSATLTQGESSQQSLAMPNAQSDALVAQSRVEDVTPGRATIGGLSYLGAGGSFGTNNAFAIVSKIGLTNDLSARPAATIEDDEVYFRIPLTYEFLPIPPGANFTGFASLSPYIGGGITLNTDGEVSALATAGVDFPLGQRFTGTVNLNVDFLEDTQVAAVVGFGYNFAGF
ncbi:MAG: hypothetical protein N4J56_007067 [Chroococcidiopsis sp. SAG 2025]|uniref:hypothetical protein n=1 Tax=Chroococcidiopsis sp. SAG 2025 TaxID=171389 RepID=UPI00293711C9|nr:hypothetical protein [Chroococcidiopsis sp. SAG 2025]MDV2997362.1 hypothetical protein [Chroococcidiopsis sp. SAG 2025]